MSTDTTFGRSFAQAFIRSGGQVRYTKRSTTASQFSVVQCSAKIGGFSPFGPYSVQLGVDTAPIAYVPAFPLFYGRLSETWSGTDFNPLWTYPITRTRLALSWEDDPAGNDVFQGCRCATSTSNWPGTSPTFSDADITITNTGDSIEAKSNTSNRIYTAVLDASFSAASVWTDRLARAIAGLGRVPIPPIIANCMTQIIPLSQSPFFEVTYSGEPSFNEVSTAVACAYGVPGTASRILGPAVDYNGSRFVTPAASCTHLVCIKSIWQNNGAPAVYSFSSPQFYQPFDGYTGSMLSLYFQRSLGDLSTLTTPVLVGGYDNPIRYPISTTFNATDAQNWCGGYGVVGFNGGLL